MMASTTSVNTSETNNRNVTLEDLNRPQAQQLMLATVIVCMVMLAGIVGNCLVIYIYTFRVKKSSPRTFILCLAFLDVLSCSVGTPYHITTMLHPYTFNAVSMCKLGTFFITFTNMASMLVLVVIGVDRYISICRRMGCQMTEFRKKLACGIVLLLALLFAWSMLLVYGHATVETGHANITGVECYVDDSVKDSHLLLVYSGAFFFIFFGSIITLVGLYTCICRKVFSHNRYHDPGKQRLSGNLTFCCVRCKSSEKEISTGETGYSDHDVKSASNPPLNNKKTSISSTTSNGFVTMSINDFNILSTTDK